MKRKLIKSAMAIALAGMVVGGNIIPCSAIVNETQTATESGIKETEVVYTQDSSFTVTIPKKITLDADKTSAYEVNVVGDISSDEKVTVVPDASFLMKDQATVGTLKADVTATVTQDKTEWTSPEIAVENGSTTNGMVSAPDLTAGTWKGTFNFNINLDGVQTPATLEAGLYNDEGVMTASWDDLVADGTIHVTDGVVTTNYSEGGNSSSDALVGKLVISDSVTSTGMMAFSYCSGLTSVTIPDSVTSMDISAFLDCTGLTSVTISSGVTSIGGGAFGGCTSLTSVNIPNSVTSIGRSAFYGCTSLTSITIPNSVTAIGDDAFTNVPHIYYNGSATGKPWGALAIN